MTERTLTVERFEQDRPHLRAVAYRLLGSLSEADDALQEGWLRASQSDVGDVRNLSGWLTTVVARICLSMLRARRAHPEEPLDAHTPEVAALRGDEGIPEEEAVQADAVGVALLVVLDRLTPPERVAFVLHDMFAVPFDEIGPLIDRSPAATRQLASRARRRVRTPSTAASGASANRPTTPGLPRQREVVSAFLAATRAGDFDALLTLLHPDVVLHADRAVVPTPQPITVRGAADVARGASGAVGRARVTGLALVNGRVGLAMATRGRLVLVLEFSLDDDGRITGIDIVAEPERLDTVELAAVEE